MGYTTQFDGHFEIRPQLSDEVVDKLNEFCEARHGGNMHPDAGMPSLYCDYEFYNRDDCTVMRWNGSEKSYEMDKWPNILKTLFFPDCAISGKMRAQGEEIGDAWAIKTDGKKFFSEDLSW